MNKYIVCFDVETTGLSDKEDYIIQLAMVKFNAFTFEKIDSKNWYIEPAHQYTIKQGAFEAHGLTSEFLKENGVCIRDIAQEIINFVSDSDYLTYNGNSFDLRFLYKDLKTFGYDFPMDNKVFYDAFSIYKVYHPSTLSAVYKQLTGQEIEGAHNAFVDVNATIEVFKQLKNQENLSIEDLANMKENQMLSPEGSIRRATNMGDNKEYLVFAFGKYKDTEICEAISKDPSYFMWFCQNIATDYTKKIIHDYIVRSNYGKKSK